MQTTTMQCFNFNSVASEWSVCAGAAADSCGKSGEGAEDEEKPGKEVQCTFLSSRGSSDMDRNYIVMLFCKASIL